MIVVVVVVGIVNLKADKKYMIPMFVLRHGLINPSMNPPVNIIQKPKCMGSSQTILFGKFCVPSLVEA